ncbi:unnamed protein product [Closterium sp. Naga37s-1]|nr:unnamed protein product [Closterium sp. Naga37s-1]
MIAPGGVRSRGVAYVPEGLGAIVFTADGDMRQAGAMSVAYVPEGLEAIVFTADGDMRQGLNNLQATATGFGLVKADNVFRVCDQPHPLKVAATVKACLSGDIDTACEGIRDLFALGYAASDIITTLFRIVKNYDMPEFLTLEFIRVSRLSFACARWVDGCTGVQMGAQGVRGS